MVNVLGMSKKSKQKLQYPNIRSARRSATYCAEIPIPVFDIFANSSYDDNCVDPNADSNNSDFVVTDGKCIYCKPFNEVELNDFARDLYLPKVLAEV